MLRLAIASLMVAGVLSTGGCTKSDTPQSTTTASGQPKISSSEIAESRRRLELSLTHEAEGGRTTLASALAPLGLMGAVPEWGLPETAADALARIGPAAVPALLRLLDDREPQVRAQAAQAFARMGPEASAAVPALTKALQDPDVDVRRSAARALGQIGPAAETAISALAWAVSQPEKDEKFDVPTVVVPIPGARDSAPGPSPSDNR